MTKLEKIYNAIKSLSGYKKTEKKKYAAVPRDKK